jgi:hypothetical protein
MSKFTILSLMLIVCGLLLLGFQSLQALMGTEIVWKEVTLVGLLKPEHAEWVRTISWHLLNRGANYLINLPLYILLLSVGGIMLILSGIIGKVR